jgi:hypothetical protein
VKKSCVPVPFQYLLPPAPAASIAQTPNGGGWFDKTTNQIMDSTKANATKVRMILRWCPPGYVNNYDNTNPSFTSTGACVVAPTTATSLLK